MMFPVSERLLRFISFYLSSVLFDCFERIVWYSMDVPQIAV